MCRTTQSYQACVVKADHSTRPCTEIVCHAKKSIDYASDAVFTVQGRRQRRAFRELVRTTEGDLQSQSLGAQGHIQGHIQSFNISRDEDSKIFVCQCSVTVKVKNVFPSCNQNFPCWYFPWLKHFPWSFLKT